MAQSRKQQVIMDEVLRSSEAFIIKTLPYLTGASRKAAEDRLVEIRTALKVGKKPGKRTA